jgi:C_GCAxxG_C_C family probable redox protein
MSKADSAMSLFFEEYACSQAVLSVYCNLFNIDHDTAMKLAAGFAGGMRRGETCGAVTGAYMVLGLNCKNENPETPDARIRVYEDVCEFSKKFEEINGSLNCNALLCCDISTEEGMQKAKEEKLFQTICPRLVKSSIELLEPIIEKH